MIHSRHNIKSISTYPLTVAVFLLSLAANVGAEPPSGDLTAPGPTLYRNACVSCHGAAGRGAPPSLVGFPDPLPDFTDCSFASREPHGDWVGVATEGGPSRGFSEMMPAFGGVLSAEEMDEVVEFVKGFCTDTDWPIGELNLPRPLVTGKAFPEDEAVLTSQINTDGPGRVAQFLTYERRFGPRNQWEVVVPFGWVGIPDEANPERRSEWGSAVGDLRFSLKRAFHHDRDSIVSAAGEIIFPTGDEDRGLGRGTGVFEPYLAWGQILPAGFFLQTQLGLELTFDKEKAPNEGFLRTALGWTGQSGQFGRAWSPMLEVLVGRDLVAGEDFIFDLVPQMQVTLNRRQHVMLNVGVRTPLNRREERDTQVIFYVLWDWFDGGLFEGW
jgi:mono/diheme cytochrome c family protein